MPTTVTAAHHSMWRHLYDSMHAAQKHKSKLKFVTLDKESNMSTLWRREEFVRICSKEGLAEKAQDIEVTTPVTGVGMRHLLGPKNPDGLNLGIHIFVYVYNVHVCMYMDLRRVLGGMKAAFVPSPSLGPSRARRLDSADVDSRVWLASTWTYIAFTVPFMV